MVSLLYQKNKTNAIPTRPQTNAKAKETAAAVEKNSDKTCFKKKNAGK